MKMRPEDMNGDILPVLRPEDLVSGPRAEGQLARDKLKLLRGDWWEDPNLGFPLLERLQEAFPADTAAAEAIVKDYLREENTDAVLCTVSG